MANRALRNRSGKRRPGRAATASVCLLIPTHALPPLDYRIPASVDARVGAVVVAPLSGHSRLGVVVATNGGGGDDLEKIRDSYADLALPTGMVEVCAKVAEAAAIPLAAALRAALPPGLGTDRFRIIDPGARWPWKADATVGRASLRRRLGQEGLRRAEEEGRIVFDPRPEGPGLVEWAFPRNEADLGRAPKQRLLLDALGHHAAGIPVDTLLEQTGARRQTLRELVRRELASLARRPKPAPVSVALGPERAARNPFARQVERVLERGGPWIWRTPTVEQVDVVAALARAARGRGEQVLVLAPEIQTVERICAVLTKRLPAGTTVSTHHGRLGRDRAGVYAAARSGDIDVLIGTRTAALVPLARPGPICVVDEPNDAHRARPGFEGLPLHVRDVALQRCAAFGGAVLFLSPFPSLRLYGSSTGVRELRPRRARRSLDIRLVDMRGTGAVLSREMVEACREGDRVGVIASRLAYAASVFCASCGSARTAGSGSCEVCGSDRAVPAGPTLKRIRDDLSSELGEPVGLLTAESYEAGRVVVGTAHAMLNARWDAVILPEMDAVLFAGSANRAERAFRFLFRATEAADARVLVQTRVPDAEVLSTALRGDYASFAKAELSRLESLGYPPFGHVVSITFTGPESAARRAVESGLRGTLGGETTVSDLVRVAPDAGTQSPDAWRLLLRAPERTPVARAGVRIARLAAKERLRVRVEVDPEEV